MIEIKLNILSRILLLIFYFLKFKYISFIFLKIEIFTGKAAAAQNRNLKPRGLSET